MIRPWDVAGDGTLIVGAPPPPNAAKELVTNGDVNLNVKTIQIQADAGLFVNNVLTVGPGVQIQHAGVSQLQTGSIVLSGASVLNNTGSLSLQSGTSITGAGTLSNLGQVIKEGGPPLVPNSARIDAIFNNFGQGENGVDVLTGILEINNAAGVENGASRVSSNNSVLLWKNRTVQAGVVGDALQQPGQGANAGTFLIEGTVTVQSGGRLTSWAQTATMDAAASKLKGPGLAEFNGANFRWLDGSIEGFGENITFNGLEIGGNAHTLDATQVTRYTDTADATQVTRYTDTRANASRFAQILIRNLIWSRGLA